MEIYSEKISGHRRYTVRRSEDSGDIQRGDQWTHGIYSEEISGHMRYIQ